ncbi:MAG: hypothetical protein AAGN66_12630 [Acidobacteriota bacterium]
MRSAIHVPEPPENPHRLAEERSLAYHRAIAAKLCGDAEILGQARQRVEHWLETGEVHPHYAEGWRDLLGQPLDAIEQRLGDPGEEMRALRQCTPFAGALDPRERWRIWRETAERLGVEPSLG